MIQRALSTIIGRLKSVLFKHLSRSWLTANTESADAAERDVSSLGCSCYAPPQSDEATLYVTPPMMAPKVPQVEEGYSDTAHACYDSRAELYVQKQLVADRIHACLLEVEAAKKHYVESQRAFFRANDEHEEVEKLIKRLEEED